MPQEQVRILFVAANPKTTAPLDLNAEYEAIEERLYASRHADRFLMQPRWKLGRDQLLDFLLQYRPHILHFSGHGTEDNLILQDSDGNPWPLDRQLARQTFKAARATLKLVVLNACYARDVAEDVSEVIDCAIGMALPVYDSTAIKFSSALYRGLGEDLSVRDAYDQARTQIALSGLVGPKTPQIVSRPGVDPRQIHPLQWVSEPPPSRPNSLPPNITRSELRQVLQKQLPSEGEFDTFVQDFFTDVHRRFSSGMDRLQRTNLLFSMKEPAEIAAVLNQPRS
jgi:hypothetical protein